MSKRPHEEEEQQEQGGSKSARIETTGERVVFKGTNFTYGRDEMVELALDKSDEDENSIDIHVLSNALDEPGSLLVVKPSLRSLEAQLDQVKAQAQVIQKQIDGHQDTIRALIGNEKITKTLLSRLSSVSLTSEDQFRKVHLTLDGIPFVFSQAHRKMWEYIETYEREDMYHYPSLRTAKKPRKDAALTNAWANPIIRTVYNLTADEVGRYTISYVDAKKEIHDKVNMPMLDVEAAIVAFAVFIKKDWN